MQLPGTNGCKEDTILVCVLIRFLREYCSYKSIIFLPHIFNSNNILLAIWQNYNLEMTYQYVVLQSDSSKRIQCWGHSGEGPTEDTRNKQSRQARYTSQLFDHIQWQQLWKPYTLRLADLPNSAIPIKILNLLSFHDLESGVVDPLTVKGKTRMKYASKPHHTNLLCPLHALHPVFITYNIAGSNIPTLACLDTALPFHTLQYVTCVNALR